ncbi:MAG: thioredoxin family protein [Candidatus Methanoperedens sp.]|nr:thioredoxin family protein [Candidatus Methanoperedens sp.]MCE8426678.1 thioredoxin family protein [Candidatus Methanoperedens sp.]
MKTKKLTSILVLILIISFAYGTYTISLQDFKLSNNTNSYLAGMTWSRSLDKSFQVAQQENKPVMIYFWAIWCQYCARFQSDTLGNPQIKSMLEKDFVLVAMDLDVDREVTQKYGVSYPPYVLFLDPKGNIIDRIAGAVDAETFLPVATQVRNTVRGK